MGRLAPSAAVMEATALPQLLVVPCQASWACRTPPISTFTFTFPCVSESKCPLFVRTESNRIRAHLTDFILP